MKHDETRDKVVQKELQRARAPFNKFYEMTEALWAKANKNENGVTEVKDSIANIEDIYIASESFGNEFGLLSEATYHALGATESETVDEIHSFNVGSQTYYTDYIQFGEVENFVGRKLLITGIVEVQETSYCRWNVYKYAGTDNQGALGGTSIQVQAGVKKRLSTIFDVPDTGLTYLDIGIIGPVNTSVSYEKFMIIDVTDDPSFDPEAYGSGYWLGALPYSLIKVKYETVTVSKWTEKEALVLGDSLTADLVWQQKLNTVLGMNVTTHALGGIGLTTTVDGNGSINPLSISDVTGKHLILVFAGYNDRHSLIGDEGDLYPANSTYIGKIQYVINTIYDLLEQADNLECKVAIITPHCVGKYSYIEYDGYDEFPVGSGQTLRDVCAAMEEVAHKNSLKCYNAWENSGINKFTWSVYSANSTPGPEGSSNDQLHLNAEVGYPHLGDRIAAFVETV